MIEYIAVDEKLRNGLFDAKAVRGIFEGSDHNIVLAKIKIKGRWEYSRKNGKGKVRC